MAQRHLSRSIVMQALFEWDFDPTRRGDLLEIVERVTKEFAPGLKDLSFSKELAKGVSEKRATLDEIIEKAAPDWPIDKIATLDRNILRLGLYELLFGDRTQVPPKVAINEAIELAKAFGSETSGKFVNGVLGAVYKELGEPGKNETSKKKDIDPATLPLDQLVGAVVFARDGQTLYLGLVHDVFGRWTLTKGHLKDNETEEAGVVRKAKEELGAEVTKIVKKLGQNEYIANIPETGKVRKRVSYYLAEAQFSPLAVGESGGLDDAKWFKLADVADLTMYDDIIPIMTAGIEVLTTNKK